MVRLLNYREIEVIGEYDNGKDLLDNAPLDQIDVIVMDYNMPVMNGAECCALLSQMAKAPKVLALSMNDDDMTVASMIRAGARGYITKNAEIEELILAIRDVANNGFHFSDSVSPDLALSLNTETPNQKLKTTHLKPREMEFLGHCCSELTYKEIAEKMFVSVRTVDGYREDLFEKLGIKSRVGLVLYAIKSGIYSQSD
jgi:DNA-binding NarL/FixJ family response regulator